MNTFIAPPNAAPLADDAFLSAQGRFGRRSYLAWNVVVTLLGILAMIVSIIPLRLSPNNSSIAQLPESSLWVFASISVLISATVCYFFFIFSIRRLHDLNRSGWLSLCYLLPIINVIFALYLLCVAGQPEDNPYGQPRPAKMWESIVSLVYVIVLAIGIVLSIIALINQPSIP
ncbi:DUF805 domain-containing protein [Acinetobacter larvae]|uniref:DUF805 domain-containing protein n=1 Tax=Acinetobacter larvae TaxID=1789224 RepID=A0A1B2LW07_9GAMM|nr:DUF805 domain-containing protein [Acinetobacter larvae]AOA57128.1 hypothetical protein BFG52_01350 [Acinetobacter larvae]